MRPLSLDEIWELEGYERRRDDFRRAIIELKKRRRVSLGDRVTLVFENRDTLLFQVQEMLRVERTREPAAIQQEIDVYNELVPGEGELSATLFIEITEPADIRPALDRLIGIDEHLSLILGEARIAARFDPKQMEEERISAVHYVRFALDAGARAALAAPGQPASLRVDHPAYRAETALSPETRASLLEDLAGGGPGLLPRPDAPPRSPGDEEVFRDGAVRAYRPARSRCEGHLVVEPVEPGTSLLDAGPELLADCQRAVQRAARLLSERHGGCRVESAARPGEPLRFDLLPDRPAGG